MIKLNAKKLGFIFTIVAVACILVALFVIPTSAKSPNAVAEMNVKTSITLYSNFHYNIYVLDTGKVELISLDEEPVSLSDIDFEIIDGERYFKIKKELAPSESLRDISLKIVVKDDESYNISYTLSVYKYALKVIYGEYNPIEKALLRDMLSYARAAYEYFGKDSEKLEFIDAILGAGYDDINQPNVNEPARTPDSNRGFDDVRINLGAVPSYRFYISEGFVRDDFDFSIGEKECDVIEGTDEHGHYLEVITYAYQMIDDISYAVTIDGVAYTEYYNIYSYYEYIIDAYENDSELINLVLRLIKYAESACIYRNSVVYPGYISSIIGRFCFESGDGSKETPYEIARPIQLYYFAWIQYLGYFNEDKNQDGVIDTVYFRLSADLDMDYIDEITGEHYIYVLPPIGTFRYPFLGNFNGEGHTITDLTVENCYEELYYPPEGVNYVSGVEMIGFFGVIGEIFAGDYIYDSQVNEVKNFVLENLTVKTETDKTLIGLVAGYVNGTVDCVGVVSSTVCIKSNLSDIGFSENLSDYSLIGYCTEKFKDYVYVMDVMLTNPTTPDEPFTVVPEIGGDGDTTGWGGSVNMKDIYTWLYNMRTSNSVTPTINNYIRERTDVVNLNGKTVTITSMNVEETNKRGTSIDNFGTFVFSIASNVNYINFMSGASKVTEYKYAYTDEDADLYYITDGTNYLSFNGSRITNETDPDNATKWYITNGANGGIISTVYNGDLYYLTVDNGTITTISTVGVTPPTNIPSWSKSGDTYACNGVPIACYDGVWQIYGDYKISLTYNNNTYYLTNDGTSAITTIQNESAAAVWTINAVNDGYTISTIIDGVTYYLGHNSFSDSKADPILSQTPTTWQFNTKTNEIYVVNESNTHYLRYSSSGGRFVVQNYNTWTNLTFTEIAASNPDEEDITVTFVDSGMDAKTVSVSSTPTTYIDNSIQNGYYDSNGNKVVRGAGLTYFPLSTTVDVSARKYEISSNNTGYIIGAEWDTTTRDTQDGNPSNLRISEYAASSVNNASSPYTISHKTSGEFTPITSRDATTMKNLGLTKYADCYEDYYASIKSNCYGLHFMNAPILMENVTKIDAYLKGEWKYGYEVPTNCIDFNLYERGFINAFAGTYYLQRSNGASNDSFFSIYQIFRVEYDPEDPDYDPDKQYKITDIKEIAEIYAILKNGEIDTSKEYIYKYTDGTTSKTITSDYEMVFNCRWLTHTDEYTGWAENRAYYFEVPVNAGEYAIGSTQGRTSAYLVYLDLAANAQLIEREKQYEEITEEQSAATVPNGVELLEKAEGGESYDKDGDGKVDVNPANSSFVSINSGASGSILFEKTDENTITHTANDKTSAEYIGVGNTLMNGTKQEELPQSVQKVTKIERTTYRDYNLVTGDYVVTIITKTTVTNEDGTSKVTYTKQVTTTDSEGNIVTDKTYDAKEVTEADAVPDTKDDVVLTAGANLLNLGFAYGQEVELTISYEYVPAEKDANGNITAQPIYRITIVNPGEEDVVIKAMLTEAGKNSGITFVIVDGNGNVIETLDKTTDIQSITVEGAEFNTVE